MATNEGKVEKQAAQRVFAVRAAYKDGEEVSVPDMARFEWEANTAVTAARKAGYHIITTWFDAEEDCVVDVTVEDTIHGDTIRFRCHRSLNDGSIDSDKKWMMTVRRVS